MKRLIQLAPRLSGVGAALFAGSALAAQMYLNPLAGNTAVDKGIYGAVTADAEAGIEAYAGLTLPAPIAATSFSSRGNIPTTSPGISGAFTDMIVDGTNTATHTVAGWFKIDSLPSAGNYQMLWAAVSYTGGAHGGYRVCVNPDGEIAIGKINGSTYAFANGSTGEPLLTSGAAIPAGTWFHLAVAIAKTDGARTATPTVFVNGKVVPQATTGTFATNLNGDNCKSLVMGTNISAAGFYVDTEAITEAATVQALAVDPTKHIYAAQWTRNVPAGGAWRPTSNGFYPWSADGMTLTSTNPLVYRGEVTLIMTATEASTLTLNASPSLTSLTTAYASGSAVLTLASSSTYTLTSEATTISAKTVLDGTGFLLGNLSITSTGSLTVGDNRTNFTVTSIDEGGKLIVTPTATEIANGRITFNVGESVTLSTKNVEVTGYNTFTATGGTITLPIPTWTPTTDSTSWDSNWTNAESAPISGDVILNLSNLTAGQTVTIPEGTAFNTTILTGASANVTITTGSGVTLGALTVSNQVTIPATAASSTIALESGAVLSLTGDGTIGSEVSGTGALRIASGTTTLSQANNYTGGTTIETGAQVTITNATALGTAGSITGGGVIFAGDTLIPNLTSARFGASWTGTVRFSGAKTNLNLNNFGSTVELNGASGYVTPTDGTTFSTAKVNLEGDGWESTNGNSNANLTFTGALGGSGTLTLSNATPSSGTCYRFASAPDFTGAITVANNYALSIGDTSVAISNSDGSKKGSITLASAVQVAAEKTWSAKSGLYINAGAVVSGSGTLKATEGDITVASGANVSSFTGAYTVAAGRKVVFNTSVTDPTVTGSGSVAVNGAGSVLTYTSTTRPTYDIEVGDGATLVLALTEDEATAVYTAANVTVASGGKVRFVRPDKWVVEETSNVYDPATAVFADATWTGGGSDTNWNTVANWSCNGQAVTAAPGTSLASLTVAAGKTITLPGAVTVKSLTTSGAFTLAGAADTSLTAKAVTLGGAVTLNAPLVLDLASALTTDKAITVNASGALTTKGTVSLTNADCAFSGPLTVESGSLTWQHNGNDKTITGAVTVKEGATFATVADYKYATTLSGALSGAGTVRVKVPTAGSQHDGARFLNLQGACAGFTGTVELEITVTGATSNSETMPRRTSVVIKPSDNVFNGSIDVVKVAGSSPFADTNTAVAEGLWPYSKIFFANNCTFAGTIGGQGTVYIGRTGDRDNTKLLAANGATSAGTVTLDGQLATYGGDIAIPDAGSTLLIQPTEAVTFAGKLSGAGKLDVETAQAVTLTGDLSGFTGSLKLIAESSLTLDTASTMALSGQLTGYGALTLGGSHGTPTVALSGANGDYHGVVTVASNAVLTNAGSSATVPFGKGKIENNGTVKLMGTTGDWGSGQLPPTSGSGDIVFCAGSTSRIAGEITTTGTVTFEPANGEGAAAAAVTFVSSGDFSEKVASIKGASVVVGEGVTLAKDETSTPLITIAAGRSLSGSGTINVPVAFENAATATMAPDATFTFNNALTVPKNVTLPGTITLGSGAVLSGAGELSGAVTLNTGVIIDATEATPSNFLGLTGTATLGDTLKVKVASLTNILDLPTTAGLTLEKVQLTDSTLPTGAKLLISSAYGYDTLKLFVPPTTPTAPAETPRDAGVDAAIAKAAEESVSAAISKIISEVTAITGTGSNGTGTRNVDGASLFENVLTLTPSLVPSEDGTYTATATVSYDFGVADMTIRDLMLTGDTEATRYVLLAAKVQNSASSNTASFASGTKLTVLNGESELTPKSVSAADATGVADAEETTGVQWLAVPIETLFPDGTGTRPLKVKASNASAAN